MFIPCFVTGGSGWELEKEQSSAVCGKHPQTAALDKPGHFAVTRLGLTSGLGRSGRSGLGCRLPPFLPLPSSLTTHGTHPNKRQVKPKAYAGFPQPYNINGAQLVITQPISLAWKPSLQFGFVCSPGLFTFPIAVAECRPLIIFPLTGAHHEQILHPLFVFSNLFHSRLCLKIFSSTWTQCACPSDIFSFKFPV